MNSPRVSPKLHSLSFAPTHYWYRPVREGYSDDISGGSHELLREIAVPHAGFTRGF